MSTIPNGSTDANKGVDLRINNLSESKNRKHMLRALYQRIENTQKSGNWALRMSAEDVGNIGGEVGLTEAQSVNLFKRLVDESLVRARLSGGVDDGPPFRDAIVEAVTDEGLREIGIISPDAEAKSPAFAPSLKSTWEAILFYGGIPTFTVYPLGLTTLYLYQKSIRTYNHTDAWYAVSLIPKTTVLGVGAEVLLWSLLYTLVAGLFAAVLFFYFVPLYGYAVKDNALSATLAGPLWMRARNKEARRLEVLAIFALLTVPFILLIFSSRFLLGNIGFAWLPALGFGIFGVSLIAMDYRRKIDLEWETATKVHSRTWLLRGLIAIYVGALISGMLAAAWPGTNSNNAVQVVDLRLPKAVLDTGAEYSCTVEEPCPLLSHTDGYWNIITPQNNDILSVPDEEVTDSKVRILLGK